MAKIEHPNYPLEEVALTAERVIRGGGTIHQKWTCRHCGSRQTMAEPNVFHRSGICEACGETSLIAKCNYVALIPLPRPEGDSVA